MERIAIGNNEIINVSVKNIFSLLQWLQEGGKRESDE